VPSWLRGGRGGSGNSTVAAASLVVEAAAWQKRNKSGLSTGKAVATGRMTDCVLSLSICAAVAAGWTPDCALPSLVFPNRLFVWRRRWTGRTADCVSSSSAGKVVTTGRMTDCVLLLSICAAVAAGWMPDCALPSLCGDCLFAWRRQWGG
jgi:hypothetical protein